VISSRALSIAITVAACLVLFETVSGYLTCNPPPGTRWNEYGWPASFLTCPYTTTQDRQFREANASVHDITAVCAAELPPPGEEWKTFRADLLAFDVVFCIAIVVATAIGTELALRATNSSRKLSIRAILMQFVIVAAFAAFTRSKLFNVVRTYYFPFQYILIFALILTLLLFVVWLWVAFAKLRSAAKGAL
jgi:hypothetical protein